MIAYRAMLDVPRELVREVTKLLRGARRARGTRTGSRALTCCYQALLVLAWFRNQGGIALVGAGFGVSRATAYRYRDELIDVLAEQAPDLHDALQQVATDGWSHVVVDGKVFRTDRCAETTTSTKGETINAWYSGKHRAPGGNVQAIMRPDGLPIWVSDVLPGHRHDLTCARSAGLLGALYWSASQLNLPALADSGYDGAGQAERTTPIRERALESMLIFANQAGRFVQVVDDGVVDVEKASDGRFGPGPAQVLDRWDDFLKWVSAAPRQVTGTLTEAQLEAPSPTPRQVFGIGTNYRRHAEEVDWPIPEVPLTFTKFASSVTGPVGEIEISGPRVDWEVETVVVIGEVARRVPSAEAWNHVAGVTLGQ
ncbi:MAG: hypothetical protein QOI36_3166, partial [Pseudonocardiales bacterium]|nr:hypothetical protein [Pseudonocardiales bacterium]